MKQKPFYTVFLCVWSLSSMAQTSLQSAHWISPAKDSDGVCPVFKKEFVLDKPVRKAVLYITAHGLYEAQLNGKRIGSRYFTPGFTPYDKELFYNTYDVTRLLNKHDTFIAMIGDGWYRGVFGPHGSSPGRPNVWGKDASLLAKLVVTYANGSQDSIQTDNTWQSGKGPLLHNAGVYFGETWNENLNFHDFQPVKTDAVKQTGLAPYPMEPVTKQEVFQPQRIFKDHLGNTIIDFGQNMAGWAQLRIKGHHGDTVKVQHFEMLSIKGNYFTADLLHADPTDIYILNGKGTEVLEPHFTYHGFRYAKVEGFVPTKTNCSAIAVHTNLKHTLSFSCSDPLINRLQKNIEWSLNSNFLEIPTDCPQRGERMGWTGDAQIFFKTAAYNRDVRLFFKKWLHDLALEQGGNGGVSKVIPDSYQPNESGTEKPAIPGWGDAAVIIPMDYFRAYGDTSILQRQYWSMQSYIRCVMAQVDTDGLWKAGTYGDSYAVGPETDQGYLAQSYYIHSLDLFIWAQGILHKESEKEPFVRALDKAKAAWAKAFLTSDTLNISTQTACVLALHFELIKNKVPVARQLVNMIHQNKDHLATGFLGTPYLLEELTKNGYVKLAYTLLEQKTMPSWLFEVTHGATTIWEKWNPYKPDGEYDFFSLNHYANGAVGSWLYETLGGISPLEPGFKKILIAPQPGNLAWAKTSYNCDYGRIVSGWQVNQNRFLLRVRIPKGASAEIILPDGQKYSAGAGTHHYSCTYFKPLIP